MALDPTGKLPGRGAYVDLILRKSKKLGIKILDRVLETKLSDEFYQELLDYVTHQKPAKSCLAMENKTKILNLLGLAMRAGKLVTGEELTLKIFVQTKRNLCLLRKMPVRILERKSRTKVLIIMFLLANCSVNLSSVKRLGDHEWLSE